MSYRQEFTNLNINVLSSGIYNQLSSNNKIISTDIYLIGEKGKNKEIKIGYENVIPMLSSETWTFTLLDDTEYTRNVVFIP